MIEAGRGRPASSARAWGLVITPEGVARAQRETGPDCRSEIERHPGDLVLPLSEVVRHNPANARITEALQGAERSDAIGNPGSPSREIHRDIDDRQKRQIAGNPDHGDCENHTSGTTKLRN